MVRILLTFLLLTSNIFAHELNILSYNVENLFDPTHVTEKKDWTFMPTNHPDKKKHCLAKGYGAKTCFETNWTEEKLNIKLQNLTEVIKSYNQQPDILALIEIEDHHVVSRLAALLGYKEHIITNSPDQRGVNVALLYKNSDKLQYIKSYELNLNLPDYPTRNILAVEFIVNSQPLLLFVNHWPSQTHPAETRVKAAKLIKTIIDKQISDNQETNIILLGDFNTVDSDRPYPFDIFLKSEINQLYDIDTLYRQAKEISWPDKNKQPLGSYFYSRNMSWTLLDHFFINSNLLKTTGTHVELASYKIHAPDFAKSAYIYDMNAPYKIDPNDSRYGSLINNVPANSNFKAEILDQIGYSDHFPIAIKLVW